MSVDNAKPRRPRTDDATIVGWIIECLKDDGEPVALGRISDILRFKHGASCHADRIKSLMMRQVRAGLVEIREAGTSNRRITSYRWLDPQRPRPEAPTIVEPPPPSAPQRVEVEVAVKADPDGDLAAAIRVEVEVAVKADPDGDLAAAIRMLADAIFALAGTVTAPAPMIHTPPAEANHA